MPTKNLILLLTCAFIWGTAFTGQAIGMGYVPPFTFTAGRSLIGALVLLPFALFSRRRRASRGEAPAGDGRTLLIGGLAAGAALFAGESFQQFALITTSVGKAGFITSLYIIFVPLIGVFRGFPARATLWAAVLVALAGLFLLSVKDGFTAETGDILCVACALCYSLQIITIDRFSPQVDGVEFSIVMFLTGSVLGTLFTLVFEPGVTAGAIRLALPAMLYVGLFSNGIAYTLQVLGQKGADPTIASLVMSLESVFAVLCGWVVLGQTLLGREIAGCVLMGAAIVMAQLPKGAPRRKSR